jgi:hypothetical protein
MNIAFEKEPSIRRYLLGKLTDDERRAVEERLMTDPEFYQEFVFTEADLIDEFSVGALSDADRERFEKHFLSIPSRRQKAQLSDLLARRASSETGARPNQESFAQSTARPSPAFLSSVAGLWRPLPAVLVAVVLLLSATVVWLLFRIAELNNDMRSGQAQQEEMQKQIADQQTRIEDLSGRLKGIQDGAFHIRDQVVDSKQSRTEGRPPSESPLFVLNPGMLRNGGETYDVIVPAGAARLHLKLILTGAPRTTHNSYSAELRLGTGKTVLSDRGMKARRDRTGVDFLMLALPAASTPHGDYVAIVSGRLANGAYEPAGTYHFRILK